jgi:molybdenum cofactor sulfurtransferase
VHCLTDWLITQLLALRHANGRPMMRLYGPATMEQRGGTVTLNFYDPGGHLVDYRRIEELAAASEHLAAHRLLLQPRRGRDGRGPERGRPARRHRRRWATRSTCSASCTSCSIAAARAAGAIRVSAGLASNFADVERFIDFAAGLRDQTALSIGGVSFDIESCRVVRDGG